MRLHTIIMHYYYDRQWKYIGKKKESYKSMELINNFIISDQNETVSFDKIL